MRVQPTIRRITALGASVLGGDMISNARMVDGQARHIWQRCSIPRTRSSSRYPNGRFGGCSISSSRVRFAQAIRSNSPGYATETLPGCIYILFIDENTDRGRKAIACGANWRSGQNYGGLRPKAAHLPQSRHCARRSRKASTRVSRTLSGDSFASGPTRSASGPCMIRSRARLQRALQIDVSTSLSGPVVKMECMSRATAHARWVGSIAQRAGCGADKVTGVSLNTRQLVPDYTERQITPHREFSVKLHYVAAFLQCAWRA